MACGSRCCQPVVFSLFIVYQTYRFFFTYFGWLVIPAVVGLVVILLTWRESRFMKHSLHDKGKICARWTVLTLAAAKGENHSPPVMRSVEVARDRSGRHHKVNAIQHGMRGPWRRLATRVNDFRESRSKQNATPVAMRHGEWCTQDVYTTERNQPMTPNDEELDITAQAFMDGELLPAERLEFLERMQRDAALRQHFCEFLYQKELVRHAYSALPAPPSKPPRSVAGQRVHRAAMAVAFAGLVGAAIGQYVQAGQTGAGSASHVAGPASRAVVSGITAPNRLRLAHPREAERVGDPC